MTTLSKSILRAAIVTGLILLIPLVAGFPWTLGDFMVAGALLFSTGLAFALATSTGPNTTYRIAAGLTIVTAFLLTWANLAVGILGSGPNPANLMYGGMILVGIIAVILGGFKPVSMSRTMFGMAAGQVLIPVIALIIFQFQRVPGEEFERTALVFGITGFFTALWVVSGLLFRRAGSNAG